MTIWPPAGARAPLGFLALLGVGAAFAVDAGERLRAGSIADPSHLVALTCSALGALGCAWLLLAACVCRLARCAGAAGDLGDALAAVLAPGAVRSLLTLFLGAALAAPLPGPRPTAAPAVVPAPNLAAAVAASDARPPSGSDPPWPDPSFGPRSQPVAVRPGDTLWGLSAQHLGPGASNAKICVEWPRWFAANRAVIEDPDLIHPGQLLAPPAPEGESPERADTDTPPARSAP